MNDGSDNSSRPGVVTSAQTGAAPLTVFAAPATGDEFNTIGERLVPKACFKVEDLLFDFGSSFIRPEMKIHLPKLTQLRNDHKVRDPATGTDVFPPLSIFGHADPVGDDDLNKVLSGRRAIAFYAMLVRDVDLWESLFTPAVKDDDWGTRSIQTMLSTIQEPIGIDGKMGGETHAAIRTFQQAHGLAVDGTAGPNTRKALYRSYMDALCGPDLKLDKASDFLARNKDGGGGKGDFQGCSEFNPLRVFSKSEAAEFAAAVDHTRRNQENAPNRRVMALLFAPGRRVDPAVWPCPRAKEGTAACRKRFFPDAESRRNPQGARREFEDTGDTFACRFYQIISDDSPCERVKPLPIPVIEEVGPVIEEVLELTAEAPLSLVGTESAIRDDSKAILSRLESPSTAATVGDTPSILGPGFGFVMVRKDPSVPRQAFRLGVDKKFDGKGTLTIASPAGKINFFKPGGDGKTPMNFTTDNVFDGADLSKKEGVVLFAEGFTASKKKDEITLTLTLSGGSKKVKPPATMKLTSVDLTLDIAPPPAPKQQPQPLPAPDKRTKGVTVSVQDDPPHARRAVLIVRPVKPPDLNHDLLLHTLSGRVDAFDEQVPAKDQKPKSGAFEIKSKSIPTTGLGLEFFVQGKVPSNKPADETYSLGINTGALGTLRADTVALTVVPQLVVHLKLAFLDPTNPAQEHAFPEGFPVTVEEAAEPGQKVGKNGALTFGVERQLHTTFTLKFSSDQDQYIATAPAGTSGTDPEKLATAAEVPGLIQKGHRVFLLPRKWSLIESDWTPDDASNFDAANARFTGVQDPAKTFGTDAKPIKLTLNPHWQYLRFEYFDRFFGHSNHGHKRIGIPPFMLEGFRQAPSGAGVHTADTRSNWAVNDGDPSKSCQCLPWVVQRKPDKTADAKPDAKVLVQFRSAAGTFIKATNATTRAIVTTGTLPPSTDPGLNVGASVADDPKKPGADRLKLYDLPGVWKSSGYFARIAGGGDDFFDKLTLAQIQASANKDPAKMLTFSLDDIVLMTAAGASLTPLTLKATDRVAIFCHTFGQRKPNSAADDPDLTREGVYKPDPATPWFSRNVKHLDTRKDYISDYPDWTRLVIAQGNLFDLFDRRTPDSAAGVVGARAAVRLVDATTGGNFAPPRTNTNGDVSIVNPNPVKSNFLTVHPFYEQRARIGQNNIPTEEAGTGRFDLALIRCCGIDAADASKELAIALNYFRFFFQPNPTISAANGNVGQAASGLAGAALANFIKTCMRGVPQRWNGPDPDPTPDVANPPGAAGAAVGPAYGVSTIVPNPANLNPGRLQVEPQAATPKLRVEVMWFLQAFQDAKIAHFIVDIYANCRAFMASAIGFGQVSVTDNTPLLADAGFPVGSFTFAHENGHGGSLSDEYAESALSASYGQDGIYYSTPGSPFVTDRNVLMCQHTTNITPRYGWHIAEWLRFLDNNTIEYQVKHRGFTFKLPHVNVATYQTNIAGAKPANAKKSFLYTHVNWPTNEHAVASIGARGKCTLFLYKLGDENFSQQVVAPGKGAMDGLLIVAVKIKFTCPTLTTFRDIRDAMTLIASNIDSVYNVTRCFITSGTANGVTYTRIRIRFVPRFLVTNYRDQPNNALTPPTLNEYADALGFTGAAATFPGKYAQRVREIETNFGTDFQVTTQTGPSAFVGSTRRLNFQLVSPLPATISFDSFFAEMVGVVPANRLLPASYNSLVQQVVPGANVTVSL